MRQYYELLKDIHENGKSVQDRTGVGTKSVFGRQMRFDLTEGFPLLTLKKTHVRSIVHELLWFLAGDTNIAYLKDNKVKIWDEWADENGDLGPVYGKQWRSWKGKPVSVDEIDFTHKDSTKMFGNLSLNYEEIDQISTLIERLKTNPDCRRLIVSAWNPAELGDMALAPCHCFFQFKVYGDELSCQLYQRSADTFLGVPFNIASYALLTHMVAHVTGLKAKDFIHTFGDAHIYNNHFEQTEELLSRDPDKFKLPTLWLNPEVKNIFDFKYDDVRIEGYESYPSIKAEVAV